jgi:hypothetical protein
VVIARHHPEATVLRQWQAFHLSSAAGFFRRLDAGWAAQRLNDTLFVDLEDALAKIAIWVADYNIRRSH